MLLECLKFAKSTVTCILLYGNCMWDGNKRNGLSYRGSRCITHRKCDSHAGFGEIMNYYVSQVFRIIVNTKSKMLNVRKIQCTVM